MLRQVGSWLLDLLYPPHCVACGGAGAWFCAECLAAVRYLDRPRALYRLGTGLAPDGPTPHLAAMYSVAAYAPPLLQAIHAFKYEGVQVLTPLLGGLLADYWQGAVLPADVIVPVPLHPSRLRQRGYNQAALLAGVLGERVGLPVVEDALFRARNTRSQVGLGRQDRQVNVQDAFRCVGDRVRGRRVLLLDDVLTTGATMDACAAALREARAGEVRAFTLARAVGDDTGGDGADPDI